MLIYKQLKRKKPNPEPITNPPVNLSNQSAPVETKPKIISPEKNIIRAFEKINISGGGSNNNTGKKKFDKFISLKL